MQEKFSLRDHVREAQHCRWPTTPRNKSAVPALSRSSIIWPYERINFVEASSCLNHYRNLFLVQRHKNQLSGEEGTLSPVPIFVAEVSQMAEGRKDAEEASPAVSFFTSPSGMKNARDIPVAGEKQPG